MLDQELLAKAEANDVQAIFEVAKAYYIGHIFTHYAPLANNVVHGSKVHTIGKLEAES